MVFKSINWKKDQKVSEHVFIGTPWGHSGLLLQAYVHWLQEDQDLTWMKLTWWQLLTTTKIRISPSRGCYPGTARCCFPPPPLKTVWKFAQTVVPDPNIIKLRLNRKQWTTRSTTTSCAIIEMRSSRPWIASMRPSPLLKQWSSAILLKHLAGWQLISQKKATRWLCWLVKWGGAEGCSDWELQREQRESSGDHQHTCPNCWFWTHVSHTLTFPFTRMGPGQETYLNWIGHTSCFGKKWLAVNVVDGKYSMISWTECRNSSIRK